MRGRIKNRVIAGQELARALASHRGEAGLLVLALPRGGVPVAAEIAAALGGELDLMLVRKLGAPGQPELAMGAIASGGIRVLNQDIVASLQVSDAEIEAVARIEQQELERREQAYRHGRPTPTVENRHVILVDDGVATGATIRAAIQALRRQRPARLTVAVPVAPPDTVAILRSEADEVICPLTPEPFFAIGEWYENFSQVSDREVQQLLEQAWSGGK